MYDPLVRVPLLVKFPRQMRAGEVNPALVSQIDIAPTILAAAGIEPTTPLPGLNLADADAERSFIFAEAAKGTAWMARTGRHKFLTNHERGNEALFDLADDPYELSNRVADPAMTGTAAALRDALTDWALTVAVPPTYLDECAATSPAPNTLGLDQARRAEARAYFESHVRQAQS